MTLRILPPFRRLLFLDLRLQRGPQERECAVPLDPPEARLDIEERRGQPAVLPVRGAPPRDPIGPVAHLGQDGFEAVGGLEAPAHRPEHPQPVQGEGLLAPLVETLHRRLVQEAELGPQLEQRGLRLGIARPLVGRLELPAPGGLLGLGQVPHRVFPLVPLALLDHGLGTEDGLHGLPEPLGAVDDAEEPVPPYRRPRATSSRRKAAQTRSFSVAVWTKPRRTFSPWTVIPRARTIASSAKVFPSRTRATRSYRSSRRSWRA